MNDPIEPLQRHAVQLFAAVEAAMLPDDRLRLHDEQARGAQLVLSILMNGEMWVSLMESDGHITGIPFVLSRNGVALTMNLPRFTARNDAV
jgi:hypothetical protein